MDYAAVAGSIVLGTAGVRACLVLSQDGLPLAAYPAAEEAAAAAVWSRLATVGPISRGFLTMQSEVWAFVQGERYGALIVADRSVRPGQVMEFAEQALAEAAAAAVLAGSDRRSEAAGLGRPDLRDRGVAGRRIPTLHRDVRPSDREPDSAPAEIVVSLEQGFLTATAGASEPARDGVAAEAGVTGSPPSDPADGTQVTAAGAAQAPAGAIASAMSAEGVQAMAADGQTAATDGAGDAPATEPTHGDAPAGHDGTAGEGGPQLEPSAQQREGRAGGEVDIIALAREFAGLIVERD